MPVVHRMSLTGVVPGRFYVTIPLRDKAGQLTGEEAEVCLSLDVSVENTVKLWELSAKLQSYEGIPRAEIVAREREARADMIDFFDWVDPLVIKRHSSPGIDLGWLQQHCNMMQAVQLAVNLENLLSGLQGYDKNPLQVAREEAPAPSTSPAQPVRRAAAKRT